MSATRKFFIGLCAFCIMAFCAAILRGCWFGLHKQKEEALICLTVAALMWWLGSSIADALKANPEE